MEDSWPFFCRNLLKKWKIRDHFFTEISQKMECSMEGSWPCFHRNLPNKWLLDIYGIHNHWKHGISRKVGWMRTKGSTELLTWGMVWMHRKALSGGTDTLWQHHGTGETLTRTFGREQELDAFEKPVGAIDNQHLQNQNRGGDGTYCAQYMCGFGKFLLLG